MILGVDAHCLRAGGGITHLREILRVADPAAVGFREVIIWSGQLTLDEIDEKPWLKKTDYSPFKPWSGQPLVLELIETFQCCSRGRV